MPLNDDSVLVEMPRKTIRQASKPINQDRRSRTVASRQFINASRKQDADDILDDGIQDIASRYKFVS